MPDWWVQYFPDDNFQRPTGQLCDGCHSVNYDIKTKKVLLTGTSFARSGFDRYPSIYSNVRAREDAENRAAGSIAEDLKSRLSAFLSSNKV